MCKFFDDSPEVGLPVTKLRLDYPVSRRLETYFNISRQRASLSA